MSPHRIAAPRASTTTLAAAAALSLVAAGCESKPPEPTATKASSDVPVTTSTAPKPRLGGSARPRPTPPKATKRKVSAKPVASVQPTEDDPLKGKWTLADATKGLEGTGKTLAASIETSLGTLECKLFDDKAPITVANFIGLARGTRPWKGEGGTWQKNKPAYDGTLFHRIIKGFMIQGGDWKKNGTGEAGFVIPDEVWEDANHDRPGLLCMANRGPNTNSAQFFITDAAAYHLDGGYTIFGECGPEKLVHEIAGVEIERGDRPKDPPAIKKITITKKADDWKPQGLATAEGGDPSASPSGSAAAGPAGSASAAPAAGSASAAPAAGSASAGGAPK